MGTITLSGSKNNSNQIAISNCANHYGDAGYGGEGIGSYVVGFELNRKRLMRYRFTTPTHKEENSQNNKIVELKLSKVSFGGNFRAGMGSFDKVANNLYGVLSKDAKYYEGDNNKFTDATPGCFKLTYNGRFEANLENIELECGSVYYLYVYYSLNSYDYLWFGGESVHTVQLDLSYETYTNCTAPTNLTSPSIVRLNTSFTISWSGQADGNSNPIANYRLRFYKNNQASPFAEITHGSNSYNFFCGNFSQLTYGDEIYCKIASIGTQSNFSSDDSKKFLISRINYLPNGPTVSLNENYKKDRDGKFIFPSTVHLVSFSAIPGTDQDQVEGRQQARVHYYSTLTGSWKNYTSGEQIQIEDGTVISFATYDGLEYNESSKTVSFKFKKNTLPVINNIIINSKQPNMTPQIIIEPINGLQYNYEISFNNKDWRRIESQLASNVLNVADVSAYVEGSKLPSGYYIRASYYDGIEWSAWRATSTPTPLYELTPEKMEYDKCGKKIELSFKETYGYNYVSIKEGIKNKVYKINNKIATVILEDNLTGSIQTKSLNLYAGINNETFHNVKKVITCNQLCTLKVDSIGLPYNNGTVKPYTNSNQQYTINFIGLSESNFDDYFNSGKFTSFTLGFINPSSGKERRHEIYLKDCEWVSVNSLRFNFSAESLCVSLLELFPNSEKLQNYVRVDCFFETTTGESDNYSYFESFFANFNETPTLTGTHIYPGTYSSEGPQNWAYFKDGMVLTLQLSIQSYSALEEAPVITIKGRNNNYKTQKFECTTNITKSGYKNPYKYSFNGILWEISNILYDDTLTFEAEIKTKLGLSKFQIINNIPLRAHPTSQFNFSQIEYDGTNLDFTIIANGNGATVKEVSPIIYVQELEKEYTPTSGEWKDGLFKGRITNTGKDTDFSFKEYTYLHIAPMGSTTFSTYLKSDPYTRIFETEKANENPVYSTVYNILPTVAYRKNQLGINLQPNSANDSQAAIVVGAYGDKNYIYFYGDNAKASLNLTTRKMDNFIIDCGSWGTGIDGSFDTGSVITGQLAAIAYSGDIEDLLQGNASNPVIIISGGQA